MRKKSSTSVKANNKIYKYVSTNRYKLVMFLVLGILTIAGIKTLFPSSAAGAWLAMEPENGIFSAGVSSIADSAASNGRTVRFAAPAPTPTPPPPAPTPPPPSPATYTCSKTLAAGGNVATFVSSIASGQTGCLRGGSYSAGSFSLNASNARLASTPGERATITLTNSEINGQGSGYERLNIISGSNGNGARLNAHNTFLYNNDFSNNNQGNISAQCTLVGSSNQSADNVKIERNRYHNCGIQDNNAHAIYSQNSNGLIVRDNIFWAIGGYPIHLYPNARNGIVEHNVLDPAPTVRGTIIMQDNSTGNVVRYNTLSGSGVTNNASGNTVTSNCTNPVFVNRAARDYRLANGSCLSTVQYDTAAKVNATW